MTSTVAIAGRTVIYPSGLQSALTLKNVGAETVYLDSQANVNTGGFPLGVNSSIVWDANRPLYAYAGNGQLLVSENSGNLFDAQAVAAEIIAGGLAGDIAAQIALNGAPPIDKMTLLAAIPLLGANVGNLWQGDATNYNSLFVILFPSSSNSAGTADVYINHYATYNGSQKLVYTDFASFYGWSVSKAQIFVAPVRGDWAQAFLTNSATLGGSSYAFVFGSTKPYANVFYEQDEIMFPSVAGSLALLAGQAPIGGLYSVTGTTTATQRCAVPHRTGRHKLQITGLTSNATASTFRMIDARTGLACSDVLSIVNATFGSMDVVIQPSRTIIEYKIAAGTAFNIALIPY